MYATFCKVPEKHSHVYMVGLYAKSNHESGVVRSAEGIDDEGGGLHVVGGVQRLELQVPRPDWS